MADDKFSLHIDDDWKKQAQEEKRKLAEAEQKRKAEEEAKRATAATTPGAGVDAIGLSPEAAGAALPGAGRTGRGARAGEPASFSTLVQSIMTQILFYLGDLAPRGSEPQVNLDMAKNQIDMLGVLEEKTVNNLSDDEKLLLDNALYEVRMRYVAIASQYATV